MLNNRFVCLLIIDLMFCMRRKWSRRHIAFSTGAASLESGSFTVQTGTSNKGRSGNIVLSAGLSRHLDGGEIRLSGGEASDRKSMGGSVSISGGNATSTDGADRGDGGALVLAGGHSMGKANTDSGGDVSLLGGDADVGLGGNTVVSSGFSSRGSSGTLELSSSASGSHGVSGSVLLSSGKSKAGSSGTISIVTGRAFEAAGGDISLAVGDGRHKDGGNIVIAAGRTSGSARTGGRVAISEEKVPALTPSTEVMAATSSSLAAKPKERAWTTTEVRIVVVVHVCLVECAHTYFKFWLGFVH